jgi:hypothetical protein
MKNENGDAMHCGSCRAVIGLPRMKKKDAVFGPSSVGGWRDDD